MKKIILLSLLVAGIAGFTVHLHALPQIAPGLSCAWSGTTITCTDNGGNTRQLANTAECRNMLAFCVLNPTDNISLRCVRDPYCLPPWQKGDKSYTNQCHLGIYYDTLGFGWNLETVCGKSKAILADADICTSDIVYCPAGLACTNSC